MAEQVDGVDYFLKLQGAQGESQQTNFSSQVKVLSWNFGGYSESSVGRTSGSGAGKVTMQPLNIVCEMDAGFTKMAGFLTQGKHVTEGVLSAVKNGSNNKAYITITIKEVFVAKLSVQASSQVPVVNVSLTYKSIETEYKKQNEQGNLETAGTHTYDASTNQTS
jgi:type VI secretion system secreted protein Hcp